MVQGIAYGVGTEGCFSQNGAAVAPLSKDGTAAQQVTKASPEVQLAPGKYRVTAVLGFALRGGRCGCGCLCLSLCAGGHEGAWQRQRKRQGQGQGQGR